MATFTIAKLVATLVLDDKGFKDKAKESKKTSDDLFDTLKKGAVVVGSIAGAFAVAKKGFDLAKEGAAIEAMSRKFDSWATSIGTVSDALLLDLRKATRGMYDDAQLMESATNFMSLGLAKTHDQVVRLTNVAGALNMNMNQLVLTLTNKTTMRFDAIGVKVDGFKEKVNELEKTMGEDAFTEAFLQQAEEQIRVTGHAAETSAGQIEILEASVRNATNASKVMLAEAITPSISEFNRLRQQMAQGNLLMVQYGGRVALTRAEVNLYGERIRAAADEYVRAEQYGAAWSAMLGTQTTAVVDFTAQLTNFGVKNEEIAGIVRQVADENRRYAETTEELRLKQIDLLAEKQKLIEQGYSPESSALQDVNKKMDDNAAKMEENAKKHKDWINGKIADLMLMKLAQDGLTNAELAYYLAFMAHSGQMTVADAQMTMDMIAGADARVKQLQDEQIELNITTMDVVELMGRYKDAWAQSLTPINYSYTVTGRGSFPNVPTSGAAVNLINQGVPPSVATAVTSGGSGGGGGGGGVHTNRRATGGPVIAGRSYDVAEFNKAETFTPNQSGRVDPVRNQPQYVRITEDDLNRMTRTLATEMVKAMNNA